MLDKNPTDNEIINAKANEIISNALKTLEPFEVRDIIAQMRETINRLQAENERLSKIVEELEDVEIFRQANDY